MEDLDEELVGEIFSEPDQSKPREISRQADGTWLVQGTAHIRDVNRETGLELPEGEFSSTIAGLCLELAGRIPQVGTRCTTREGVVLEVAEATPRRVRLVRILPAATPTGAA
jgi:putative hemolysin